MIFFKVLLIFTSIYEVSSFTSTTKNILKKKNCLINFHYNSLKTKSCFNGNLGNFDFKTIGIGKFLNSINVTPNLVKAFQTFSAVAFIGCLFVLLNRWLWTPSRTYVKDSNTVAKEYDAWSSEGILEYYWGEHIHLGYYSEKDREAGYTKKNFIQAKYDFVDEMMKFGGISTPNTTPLKVLDVGCGIGGTTRYLAKKFSNDSQLVGITLSPFQVQRATELAKQQNVANAKFEVMDALAMTFPDNYFDVVWACESGEHMPDKKKYVEEMTRVLKPGGKIVIATWCQRDDIGKPFDTKERKMLDFLYSEWSHPFFISINDYKKLMENTNKLDGVSTADWTLQTIASWRHSIWVGICDPFPVIARPRLWLKTIRDAVTLERMHRSFKCKLMEYGMMAATKKLE